MYILRMHEFHKNQFIFIEKCRNIPQHTHTHQYRRMQKEKKRGREEGA
jgi:hypothetical protein